MLQAAARIFSAPSEIPSLRSVRSNPLSSARLKLEMAQMPARLRYSYADYKSLPDDQRCELLDGELIKMPSPSSRHQDVLRNLLVRLDGLVSDRALGEVYPAPLDVVLGEDVVQPDLLFISKDRLGIVGKEEVQSAPDLVIEILSSSTAARDKGYKRILYARHGVQEYWLADPPNGTIEILLPKPEGFEGYRVFKKDQSLHSPFLAGFEIPLHEVF